MTMQSEGPKMRKVPGRPGVLEKVGAYRAVMHAGGPYVLDQGPTGGRETPRMTESMPYLTGEEDLRNLTGNPRAKPRGDVAFASSLAHSDRSKRQPTKR